MYWWTWFLTGFAIAATLTIALLAIEAAELRADLLASIEEEQRMFEEAARLMRVQNKLAAIARHPATGDVGESIMKVISQSHQS